MSPPIFRTAIYPARKSENILFGLYLAALSTALIGSIASTSTFNRIRLASFALAGYSLLRLSLLKSSIADIPPVISTDRYPTTNANSPSIAFALLDRLVLGKVNPMAKTAIGTRAMDRNIGLRVINVISKPSAAIGMLNIVTNMIIERNA